MPRPLREVALLTDPADRLSSRLAEASLPVLAQAGWTVRRPALDHTADIESRARAATAAGVDAVVVCGGDRAVHHALQALAGTNVPLGVLPTGRHDLLAEAIGSPPGPKAARHLVGARPQRVDLGRAGDRWFATALVAGGPGGAVPLTSRSRSFLLALDGVEHQHRAVGVVVADAPSCRPGRPGTPVALLDDGLLDVLVLGPRRRQLAHHRVRRVSIAAPATTAYVDGVRFGDLPLSVECVPAALWVLA